MRRLLEYFDQVFDPDYRIAGSRLGDLVENVLDNAQSHAMPEFGTAGDAGAVSAKSSRSSVPFGLK